MEAFKSFEIKRFENEQWNTLDDTLSIEEALQIRIEHTVGNIRKNEALSITMRTPGDDFELAAGLLYSEGIIDDRDQIIDINYCGEKSEGNQYHNTVTVNIEPSFTLDLEKSQRRFLSNSSCGICGKINHDQLITHSTLENENPWLTEQLVFKVIEQLKTDQIQFAHSGANHAAALYNQKAECEVLKEDIGRHNALDKLIGSLFLESAFAKKKILVLSGRNSYEMMSKAAIAKISVVLSIGAPTSLAVDLAKLYNITLIGFIKKNKFNTYNGWERFV